jgi:hypothetical protein
MLDQFILQAFPFFQLALSLAASIAVIISNIGYVLELSSSLDCVWLDLPLRCVLVQNSCLMDSSELNF